MREEAYLGVDVGSISTKGVVIDGDNHILASAYIWTEGDPIGAVKRLIADLDGQFDHDRWAIRATGTTGSARKLVGAVLGATVVKNEITAHPTHIAARCTVFAESDLVHKIQVGHTKEDIVAGLCQAVVGNYLNNVGKGKRIREPIVFQGGVSKNIGVVKAFEKALGEPVIVDDNGHLMGAIGAAILARGGEARADFNFDIEDIAFVTREVVCGRCPNRCEIICVYRDGQLIDSWGNRCENGEITVRQAQKHHA